MILEYVLKLKKCHFYSLQNIFYCQAEYPHKTDISVKNFNECFIEKHRLISKIFLSKLGNRRFNPNGIHICNEEAGLAGMLMIYEPQHWISNNVVCVTSKISDSTTHTGSLIRAFASRLNIL